MLRPDETYDLTALSRVAGVTPRTIRYYVAQGLLPSPGGRGPGARYERGHRDRLELIKRLQREHLPLSEIRKRLTQMDDEAVKVALRAPEPEGDTPALEYVRQVLAGGGPMARTTLAASRSIPEVRRSSLGMRAPASPSDMELVAREQRSQWERIALAPDVELHVRRPLSRAQNRLVERLIDLARKALEEGAP